MVDPRVIHVMLAEEEVSLSYYKSNYTLTGRTAKCINRITS